ncbi:MAG: OsmC family protein [Crocinitomicaceae bacterium]|nr:OsmC family protein [Crocinitomicaceae bacterium]MDP4683948.1 OsmC family protein [Crocinitomicaceae bacterium]MDP4865447.1 OsmC family protein [Crocinitomicaceae bacterium]
MAHEHTYKLTSVWTGNKGEGTKNVRTYDRSHTVSIQGKPSLFLTTDNAAVGDKSKLNPEDLLVSALSSCHLLSYLYLCAMEGIVVTSYTDNATGNMIEEASGTGSFKEVTLNPIFSVTDESMVERAIELHHKAHEICYIANSVNFEVKCNPSCNVD